jgi:mevalonate kinase
LYQHKETDIVHWTSLDRGKEWFRGTFNADDFKAVETSDHQISAYLEKLLRAAASLASINDLPAPGYNKVITRLKFDRNWGFGSSSTLITNIASWFRIDPFELHFKVSEGSGYDIACAHAEGPIQYLLSDGNPKADHVTFNPEFKDRLFFVYLGKKQNTEQSISRLPIREEIHPSMIDAITTISDRMIECDALDDFESLMISHEEIIAQIIKIQPVKKTVFKDLPGMVKSLGAWGGDFVMLTWHDNRNELASYLQNKGLNTFFSFDELAL